MAADGRDVTGPSVTASLGVLAARLVTKGRWTLDDRDEVIAALRAAERQLLESTRESRGPVSNTGD